MHSYMQLIMSTLCIQKPNTTKTCTLDSCQLPPPVHLVIAGMQHGTQGLPQLANPSLRVATLELATETVTNTSAGGLNMSNEILYCISAVQKPGNLEVRSQGVLLISLLRKNVLHRHQQHVVYGKTVAISDSLFCNNP